jgi:hypothetical protein
MTRYLLMIGAQRSGTTYLYRLLDEHPEIAMAKPLRPEPKFFLDPAACERGLAWYEATYFSEEGAAPVHGEKSTSYIESSQAAERAGSLIPNAHILVMLRDPIERAISNWRFTCDSGLEERPLERALRESLDGERTWDPAKTSVNPYAYLQRGRYAQYLEQWRHLFPERLHVSFIEELAGNRAEVASVYRFVGVDDSFEPQSLEKRVNAAERPVEGIDAELIAQLRMYFADSDASLRRDLGRDLPWDVAR